MRFAGYLTALRAWCKQCLPGSVKTRRIPPGNYRDATVYGRITTRPCMVLTRAPLPPPSPPLLSGTQQKSGLRVLFFSNTPGIPYSRPWYCSSLLVFFLSGLGGDSELLYCNKVRISRTFKSHPYSSTRRLSGFWYFLKLGCFGKKEV